MIGMRHRNSGFTLIEIIIGLTLFALLYGGLTWLITTEENLSVAKKLADQSKAHAKLFSKYLHEHEAELITNFKNGSGDQMLAMSYNDLVKSYHHETIIGMVAPNNHNLHGEEPCFVALYSRDTQSLIPMIFYMVDDSSHSYTLEVARNASLLLGATAGYMDDAQKLHTRGGWGLDNLATLASNSKVNAACGNKILATHSLLVNLLLFPEYNRHLHEDLALTRGESSSYHGGDANNSATLRTDISLTITDSGSKPNYHGIYFKGDPGDASAGNVPYLVSAKKYNDPAHQAFPYKRKFDDFLDITY